MKGEDLDGIFYENEPSTFNANDETTYKVEKILGKKKIKEIKYVPVMYKGWPDKLNERVTEGAIT